MRLATEADIPRTIDLVERLREAVGGPQRVCRIKTGETLAGLIHSPDGVVYVTEGGFIAGDIARTVISPDPVAVERGWYAEDRSGLSLLRTFETWADTKGATLKKFSCIDGPARRILERAGYRLSELAMVK